MQKIDKLVIEAIAHTLQDIGSSLGTQLDKLQNEKKNLEAIMTKEALVYIKEEIDVLGLLIRYEKIFKQAWSAETCYPPAASSWSHDRPSFGQCAVTALVVQDLLGGIILHCQKHHHYWNLLPSGREVDLTRSQFTEGTGFVNDGEKTRDDVLEGHAARKALTKERYKKLKECVMNLDGCFQKRG